MSQPRLQMLLKQLEDERSKRVIFVSHCVLNENTPPPPSPSLPLVHETNLLANGERGREGHCRL
jgi:hypothetical protein